MTLNATYAIAGATGQTGGVVAQRLLKQGRKVRVIVRDAQKGGAWAARGAEVAVSDLGDPSALSAALEGVAGFFVLIPPHMTVEKFREYQYATIDAIEVALKAAKVPHVVLLSSIGVQSPEGTGPIAALAVAEEKFSSIPGTSLTALRACSFTENVGLALATLDKGVVTTFSGDVSMEMVSTSDIGELAAELLIEGSNSNQVVELGGPEASYRDVARIVSGVIHKEVGVDFVPLEAVADVMMGMGVQPEFASLYQELMAGLSSGKINWEGTHRTVKGSTTLETVLTGMLAR